MSRALLSGALRLLFGGEAVHDLALFRAVFGTVEAVVESGQFDVGLKPVGIVFHQQFQLPRRGFVISRRALRAWPLHSEPSSQSA